MNPTAPLKYQVAGTWFYVLLAVLSPIIAPAILVTFIVIKWSEYLHRSTEIKEAQ